jgi:hypothetical protein
VDPLVTIKYRRAIPSITTPGYLKAYCSNARKKAPPTIPVTVTTATLRSLVALRAKIRIQIQSHYPLERMLHQITAPHIEILLKPLLDFSQIQC